MSKQVDKNVNDFAWKISDCAFHSEYILYDVVTGRIYGSVKNSYNKHRWQVWIDAYMSGEYVTLDYAKTALLAATKIDTR